MSRRRPIGALYDRFLRKAPKQSRSRTVVESVLEAASQLLPNHDDDEQVTLNDIAERAGVGVGSLYDYFSDRGSVLAGLAAKVTEENLVLFEEELERSRNEPLPVAIRGVIDLMFDTYLRNVRVPRVILRVAHRAGLMPIVAENQHAFSVSLAAALRLRDDVRHDDLDAVAYVLTSMAMGVIHTLIWADPPRFTETQLREQVIEASLRFLRPAPAP